MMRQTLGNETRLSGDLTRSADGTLTLTTRVGASPGVAVMGGPEEMDRLLDEFPPAPSTARPSAYRYAVWLGRSGNGDDAPVLAELAASSGQTEQLWALVGRSGFNALSVDPLQAIALAREALALDPSFQKARWNLTDGYSALGWSEADLQEAQTLSRILRRRDPRVTGLGSDRLCLPQPGRDLSARLCDASGKRSHRPRACRTLVRTPSARITGSRGPISACTIWAPRARRWRRRIEPPPCPALTKSLARLSPPRLATRRR